MEYNPTLWLVADRGSPMFSGFPAPGVPTAPNELPLHTATQTLTAVVSPETPLPGPKPTQPKLEDETILARYLQPLNFISSRGIILVPCALLARPLYANSWANMPAPGHWLAEELGPQLGWVTPNCPWHL